MNDVKLIYGFYLVMFFSLISSVFYIDLYGVDYSFYMFMKVLWGAFVLCIFIKKIIGEVYAFDWVFLLIGGSAFSVSLIYVFNTLRT